MTLRHIGYIIAGILLTHAALALLYHFLKLSA
jgi:hypothetical protein